MIDISILKNLIVKFNEKLIKIYNYAFFSCFQFSSIKRVNLTNYQLKKGETGDKLNKVGVFQKNKKEEKKCFSKTQKSIPTGNKKYSNSEQNVDRRTKRGRTEDKKVLFDCERNVFQVIQHIDITIFTNKHWSNNKLITKPNPQTLCFSKQVKSHFYNYKQKIVFCLLLIVSRTFLKALNKEALT